VSSLISRSHESPACVLPEIGTLQEKIGKIRSDQNIQKPSKTSIFLNILDEHRWTLSIVQPYELLHMPRLQETWRWRQSAHLRGECGFLAAYGDGEEIRLFLLNSSIVFCGVWLIIGEWIQHFWAMAVNSKCPCKIDGLVQNRTEIQQFCRSIDATLLSHIQTPHIWQFKSPPARDWQQGISSNVDRRSWELASVSTNPFRRIYDGLVGNLHIIWGHLRGV
jgi:hypothetical protein